MNRIVPKGSLLVSNIVLDLSQFSGRGSLVVISTEAQSNAERAEYTFLEQPSLPDRRSGASPTAEGGGLRDMQAHIGFGAEHKRSPTRDSNGPVSRTGVQTSSHDAVP